MKVKREYVVCDVCEEERYSEITEIIFSYDGKSHSFDCCYQCLRGNERVRKMYGKIVNFIKASLK